MSIQQPSRLVRNGFYAYLLAISALLGGCATLFPPVDSPESPPEATPAPSIENPAPPVEAPAPSMQTPVSPIASGPAPAEIVPMPLPEPQRVGILLSDDLPMFVSAADQIKLRLGDQPYTIHNLDGDSENSTTILEELRRSNPDQLIAIGLLAAQAGRQLHDVPMVFCYVFNYEEHGLISTTSKGVNLLPPFEMQLEAWKTLSPNLDRIGVVTGPYQEALVGEMQQAADEMGIELLSRTVNSDQEALYSFQRLTPEIQGLWLVPDNRILSPRVVGEIMSYAEIHRIQVVVFGRRMLKMGALMAVTTRVEDVADQVVAQLEQLIPERQLAGPDMITLTKMDLNINPTVARTLGLTVSEQSARLEQSQ